MARFSQGTFSEFGHCLGGWGARTEAWSENTGILTVMRSQRTNGGLPQTPNTSPPQMLKLCG